MSYATLPFDETQRLAALRGAQVLDTPPEPEFDNIVRLAAAICEAPMALVSLVDEDRQWFKARVGISLQETPREHSFCSHALTLDEAMTVPDATLDPRFVNNPLVTGDPNIRFYTGVPLRTSQGSAIGTLCVLDRVPRKLSPLQTEALKMLADQAAAEMKLRAELASRTVLPPASARGADVLSNERPEPAAHDAEAALLVSGAPLDRRYRLLRSLGRGGMGFVLGAHDLQADRPVAIKFLRRHIEHAQDHIKRFAREARTLMNLQSPHVVRIFDVGNTVDGVPYIVMEQLAGEDLGDRLARLGPLPIDEVVRLALQACDVLAEAHEIGLVHRDLKPGNLFLAQDEQGNEVLKVLDFGIAKVLANAAKDSEASGDTTDTSVVLGSPNYMPPEQMYADPGIDGQADVWSLGVVMFEALSGHLPFTGNTVSEIWQAVLTKDAVDIRTLRPEVPEALAELIALCLRRDRAQRLPDVWSLAQRLAPLRHAATF